MPEITVVSEHTADITELVCHTQERLRSYTDDQDHCEKKELICRVPEKYHKVDGSDYVPRRWSIGPYHKGNEHLENMEINKLSSLNYICKLFPATSLEKYYEELQSLEIEARTYYSGDIHMDPPSFLHMLLLDSCFILCNLVLKILPAREESDECYPPALRLSIVSDVQHDLLLFENQIPFFILQRMYNVATGDETPNERVAFQLGIMLKVFIQDISRTTIEYKRPPEKIHHLLHLLHWLLRPSEEQNDHSHVGSSWLIKLLKPWCKAIRNWLADLQWKSQTDNNQQQKQFRRWGRAVEYHEAGVHFKLPRKLSHSPLNIVFENGELRIPKLIIDEKTSFIFGNLLAFEQQTAQLRDFFITTYITFMSQLLSMPEDVKLLSRKGIIENHLGCNEDVSELFKNLTKFRFLELGSRGYLKPVCYALEKHYENPWNHWFAWLRHKHMTNPWLILSLVVAAIVAISAVVQAFCSVIPLVHGKDSKNS